MFDKPQTEMLEYLFDHSLDTVEGVSHQVFFFQLSRDPQRLVVELDCSNNRIHDNCFNIQFLSSDIYTSSQMIMFIIQEDTLLRQ